MENVNNDLARQLETKLAFAKKLKLESKPAIWQSRWLLLLSDETPAVKFTGETAFMFADNDTGENIYPSIALLAALTGYSRRWVSQCMTRLQRKGYLQGTPQPGKPTRYAARVPERTLEELSEKLTGLGNSSSDQCPEDSSDPGTPVHTEVGTPVPRGQEPEFLGGRNPSSHKLLNEGSEGKIRKNTHTAEPKTNGRTKPEPARSGVCVEDSFSWKEDGQKEGQTPTQARPSDAGKVIDFASKRQGSASPQPAEQAGPDAGSARDGDRELFETIRDAVPWQTNTSPAAAWRAFLQLSPDDRQLAADAVPHFAKARKAEAQGANRTDEQHRQYTPKLENWLAQRRFENFAAAVRKDRAERVPGFPLGVRLSDVRQRVQAYLMRKRDHPDDTEWHPLVFDPAENDSDMPDHVWERVQGRRLEKGDPAAVQPLADLGPPPDDPACILPDCIMDEFRDEIASLNAEIEQKRAQEQDREARQRQAEAERERQRWWENIDAAMREYNANARDRFGNRVLNRDGFLERVKRAAERDCRAWDANMQRDYGPGPLEEGTVIDRDLIELARKEMPHVKAREVVGL